LHDVWWLHLFLTPKKKKKYGRPKKVDVNKFFKNKKN